ncbi:hypothetical protein GT347_23290 [Xylophilus rhododendri]|uniref:Uncharacterized protein n=1 Tax=Xylophilus rhododendri TaxID=2697032 RepID=A0A857JC34_9BURK|nr:hypothetical protein [Xylophilus rhododendri]QHJ00650.1 hypothetical protein GT347_23290 [Xylophilus rhododendri]
MLDGLPQRAPSVDASCCDFLLGAIGFDVREQREIDKRHRRLMRLCRALPRSAPAWPGLSQRLDRLHRELQLILGRNFPPSHGSELLDTLSRLGDQAELMLHSVHRKEGRRQAEYAPAAMRLTEPPPLLSTGVPPKSIEPLPAPELHEPCEPRPERPVFIAAGALADPHPCILDRQLESLQAAIQTACSRLDGDGRMLGPHAAELYWQLMQVAGVEGRPDWTAPGQGQGFHYLRPVLQSAIASMPEPVREAVSPWAWKILEELQQ